jgi:hypothetical protein
MRTAQRRRTKDGFRARFRGGHDALYAEKNYAAEVSLLEFARFCPSGVGVSMWAGTGRHARRHRAVTKSSVPIDRRQCFDLRERAIGALRRNRPALDLDKTFDAVVRSPLLSYQTTRTTSPAQGPRTSALPAC